MYRKYFGLRELPFRNTPDEDFFFGDADRKEIIEALEYIATRRDALVKVTGEVGSGKTTLLRILAERLRKKGFKIVYIPTPRLTADEILRFIAKDLGVAIDNNVTKADLYNELYRFLVKTYNEYKGVVVLIDEAHTIPLDTLEEVRLLSNIETNKDKLITIILFGQPDLDKMLNQAAARQLKSRISHSFILKPLTPDLVYKYLNFRMHKAGYNGDEFFSRTVSKHIHKVSQGLPRLINIMADKLLFSVYSRGGVVVEDKDIKVSSVKEKLRLHKNLLISLGFGTFILIVIYILLQESDLTSHVQSEYAYTLQGGIKAKSGSGQNSEENMADVSVYLPWDPDSLVVVLATVPCNSIAYIEKIKNYVYDNELRKEIRDIYVYEFNKENNKWCYIIKGGFNSIKETENFITHLPDFIRKNSPYAIEVYKINRVLTQRRAKIYEAK